MKFCQKCGKEIREEAVICPGCGCLVAKEQKGKDGLATASKVFLILACILQGFFLIPLLWCLPMTISAFGKMNRGERIGTGFTICIALFVSLIGGILLACRPEGDL